MPKLRPTLEQIEKRNFSAFVIANMKAMELKQEDIADCIGVTQGAVSNRFNEKTEWSLSEMAKVCELFNEQYVVGGIK